MFSRVFEHLKNQEAKAACMLPNVARYQLRHTPICLDIISKNHRKVKGFYKEKWDGNDRPISLFENLGKLI